MKKILIMTPDIEGLSVTAVLVLLSLPLPLLWQKRGMMLMYCIHVATILNHLYRNLATGHVFIVPLVSIC